MDSPLLTLVIAVFFGFFSLIVESQNLSPPPPKSSPPVSPPPYSPPPSFRSPPPPFRRTPPSHRRPPQSARKRFHRHPPPPRRDREHHHKHPSPPAKREKLNTGKKVGLMFIGVAAILQVCVVSFLLISRRQLLKAESGN